MDGIVGFVDGDFNRGSARVQEAEVAGGNVACEEEEGFYLVSGIELINNEFVTVIQHVCSVCSGMYVPRRSIKDVVYSGVVLVVCTE